MLITSHMVWGYVLGKAAAHYRKLEPNIPLLILAGGLPDFDLFSRQPYGTLFGHHGISHSWLIITLLFLLIFYKFGRQTLPYFIAVIQHPIFGDLITNRIPLFFPVTLSESGFNLSDHYPVAGMALEILGFLVFLIWFISSRDWKKSVASASWNKLWLLLWIPLLGITALEALWYFEPTAITVIYSVYALASSLFLLGIAVAMAARSFFHVTS